jgi:hypothetical protein
VLVPLPAPIDTRQCAAPAGAVPVTDTWPAELSTVTVPGVWQVVAAADTDNFLTDVGFEVSVSNSTERTRVSLNAAYDLKNQVLDGWTKFTIGDTSVRVTLDHVVKVAHKLDERNTVMPSVSLKNGAPAVGWKHKFSTGSLEAEYAPSESLDVGRFWIFSSRDGY